MLCIANTLSTDQSPESRSWTSEHFEAYVRYLNKRQFITYALGNLSKHLHKCGQLTGISGLISLLREELTKYPASYIFQHWDPCDRGEFIATNVEQSEAMEFRGSLLHAATRMGYSRVVEGLLMAGAEVEACLDGKTPLIVSAESGDLATARVLLDHEALIDARDGNKQTALHLAAANGHNLVAGVLLDRGADKEAKDNDEQTALHLAAANGNNSMIGLLIDRGADRKAKDTLGWQALHTAAWNGHERTIQLLVRALGTNKEEGDRCGWTALHVATMNGCDTASQWLTEHLGADKEAKDNEGWTALHFAAALGLEDTARLLIKTLGVNRNARNKEGKTALDLAQQW
jgi:ankyrin repeat protein